MVQTTSPFFVPGGAVPTTRQTRTPVGIHWPKPVFPPDTLLTLDASPVALIPTRLESVRTFPTIYHYSERYPIVPRPFFGYFLECSDG